MFSFRVGPKHSVPCRCRRKKKKKKGFFFLPCVRVPGACTKHWLLFFFRVGAGPNNCFSSVGGTGTNKDSLSCECRALTILFRVGGRHNNVLSRVSRRALAFRPREPAARIHEEYEHHLSPWVQPRRHRCRRQAFSRGAGDRAVLCRACGAAGTRRRGTNRCFVACAGQQALGAGARALVWCRARTVALSRACRHEQFFAGQTVVVPGHKTSRVRPSARVVVVQAQRSTRCRGRAQVFCSFTRAGSRHQVPGARARSCFLFSVQAAGPNTGVFCVFCFPLARACTWRRVLVSGHEPGCVLSRVQAPGTNTAVFVFWVLFPPARADAPARTRLFRAGASRFVCVCGHEQSCFLFARLQTHVLVSACVRVCLSHEDNTSTTCSLCSVRADARHRASNHPERASVCVCVCVCTRQRAAVVVCVRTHEHECCLVRSDERRAEHQEERTTRTAGRNNERERRAHSAPSVRSTVTPSPKSTASSPAAPTSRFEAH
ncbi:MC001R [Molluscum contagiosum virus subtype 1]|uniref:MC001R n=1 Tax=Molluscum contagiosum virus subtype 1 TaxID=10280 RepID=Q98172_MCV1|nr:MC001R [Molluscum contagiosum virus subtype 1]AAC55129.1 MC001R [Molluscum contagiosum virus subtype 1]